MKRKDRKKPRLLAGVLVGALAVAALAQDAGKSGDEWVAPSRAARKKNPIAADADSIARGKALYAQECLSCHGPTGKGDGSAAKDLEKKPADLALPATQDQSDGALFWKISEGKKPMPAMTEKWNEQQRWDVVNYIHTFKKAEK